MTEFPPEYCPYCGGEIDPVDPPRYQCNSCNQSVYHSPTAAVQVAVVERSSDGSMPPRVLVGERGAPPAAGRYTTPGGHIDLWERPREAAVRELAEETGLDTDPDTLRLIQARDLSPTEPEPGLTDRKQVICLDFAVSRTHVAGNPRAADDLNAVQWVSPDEFDTVPWAYDLDSRVCQAALRSFDEVA